MPLPARGKISISDILKEMGRATNTTANLDSLAKEWYAKTKKNKFNTINHLLSHWHGEAWVKDTLSVSPQSVRVQASGGIIRFQIQSNTSWTLKPFGGVVTIRPSDLQGTGNKTIQLTFPRNPNNRIRTGSIQINTSSNIGVIPFSWTQLGRSGGGGGGGKTDPIIADDVR